MTRTVLIVIGAIVCVAPGVACGGGDDGRGSVDDTAGEITSDELSRMMLTLEDFGPDFAAFGADPKNGAQDLQTMSEQDFDPAGERADLEAAGFAAGYRNLYQQPETSGIFFAGDSVTLFATKEGAANYVADSRKELTEYLGKTIGELTIKSSTPFDVEVADGAAAANQEIDVIADDGSTVTLWYTAVLFRRGRLAGVVAISGISLREAERRRLQDKVEALASTMNERMSSVLAGTAPAAAVP